MSPSLRIPKRKDGKEGSESDSSSSSSDDSKKKGKGKGIEADISSINSPRTDLAIKAKVEAPKIGMLVIRKIWLLIFYSDRQKRLTVKQDQIVRLGAVCSICTVKFSFFKRPVRIFISLAFYLLLQQHQCKECKNHVCSNCSSGGIVSIVLGWGGKPRRVCSRCVDDVKKKIEKRATLMPELKIQAEKEAKQIDYRFAIAFRAS